jgi:catechol 2,3-dioxygenase-like lactoylglutathione lyase family enzyme
VLHHLTIWVPDIARAEPSWTWLLGQLGYRVTAPRDGVLLFRCDDGASIVKEQSRDMVPGMLHSRLRPGLNHVAFNVARSIVLVDLVAEAVGRGWKELPIDGHPIAGGADVAFLEDRDGFEVELVAPLP